MRKLCNQNQGANSTKIDTEMQELYIHLDKSLAYSSFKVQKLNARKICQKHKTDSQFTDSERKHVVACRSKEQMKNLSQIF